MEDEPLPKILQEAKFYPRYTTFCLNCGYNLHDRKDWKHGIHFCEICGFVTKQVMVVNQGGNREEHSVDLYPEYNRRYAIEQEKDIKKLREIYEKQTQCRQEYRIERDYKHYTDIVASNFNMTKYQKEEVLWYIREAKGVNKFCKNCSYEQIILALCVMVMRSDKRRIKLKDYKIVKEEGLTERKYTTILENAIKNMR